MLRQSIGAIQTDRNKIEIIIWLLSSLLLRAASESVPKQQEHFLGYGEPPKIFLIPTTLNVVPVMTVGMDIDIYAHFDQNNTSKICKQSLGLSAFLFSF